MRAASQAPESLPVREQEPLSLQAPVQVPQSLPVPAPPQQQEALLFPAESLWKALQLR